MKRKEEKRGMERHSCTENEAMNHMRRLAEDMSVCVCVGPGRRRCLKGVFKIVLTFSLRERQKQGQVN